MAKNIQSYMSWALGFSIFVVAAEASNVSNKILGRKKHLDRL